MKKIPVTTFRGFTKVKGKTTLKEVINDVKSGKHASIIRKINKLIAEDKVNEANNVKRQLYFQTVTSNYKETRNPHSIESYNDIITIDIDHLSDEQVLTLRPLIEQDPATVASFLTAKQHGYKIFAYLQTLVADSLRKTFFHIQEISYRELETYHAQMYELTRVHYEELLGIEVDTSGKDLSRGIFISFDPHAFYSEQRAQEIKPIGATIIAPEPTGPDTRKKGKKYNNSTISAVDIEVIDPAVSLEFDKCVRSTKRIISYKEGSYNNFLFTLGNKCFRKNLDENLVKALTAYHFGDGKWDTDTPIENAYQYKSKTEEAMKDADKKISPILRVMEYLNKSYVFRRNTVLDRLEMKILGGNNQDNDFYAVRAKDLNSIFVKLQQLGIRFSLANLKSLIDSDFAGDFDPFDSYFSSLPAWDGKTDYIGELADSIQTDDRVFWKESLCKWIVSMAACPQVFKKLINKYCSFMAVREKGKVHGYKT